MKVIGFNSYKGGACRTTTCYNVIPYLAEALGASPKRPILLVDFDLESMGMTKLLADGALVAKEKFDNAFSANSFFDEGRPCNKNLAKYGLNTAGDSNVQNDEYFEGWASVGSRFGLEAGAVLFVGADAKAKSIAEDTFEKFKSGGYLRELIYHLEADYDDDDRPCAVVLDCAAGMQKTTQIALGLVNVSVTCLRPTAQFRASTFDYLNKYYVSIMDRSNAIGGGRRVILLPTAVPRIVASVGSDAYKKIALLRDDAFEKIGAIISSVTQSAGKLFSVDGGMVDFVNEDEMGIPEVERLKWQENETLLSLGDKTEDELHALARFEKLASLIAEESK